MTELMQMIIDKLGVKAGEKFNTSDSPGVVFCFIGSGELAVVLGGIAFVEAKSEVLINLLNGKSKIIKLPFKPQRAEKYYFVDECGEVGWSFWVGYDRDYYRFNIKNCFRTEEEITEEDKKRIVAEMKSKYETE